MISELFPQFIYLKNNDHARFEIVGDRARFIKNIYCTDTACVKREDMILSISEAELDAEIQLLVDLHTTALSLKDELFPSV